MLSARHVVILVWLAVSICAPALQPSAQAGPEPCVSLVVDGVATATCTGDQAAGVTQSLPPVVLRVFDLGANIAPARGLPGIKFFSQGANGHNGSSGLGLGHNGDSGRNGIALATNFSGGLWRILTQGNVAHGIQVQSLGGNGGRGGNSTYNILAGPLTGIGGDGGRGGDGGTLTVSSTGAVTTNGDSAHGVFVLSPKITTEE